MNPGAGFINNSFEEIKFGASQDNAQHKQFLIIFSELLSP